MKNMITERVGFFTVTRPKNWEEEREKERLKKREGIVYIMASRGDNLHKISRASSIEKAIENIKAFGPGTSIIAYIKTNNTLKTKEKIKRDFFTEKDWCFLNRAQINKFLEIAKEENKK